MFALQARSQDPLVFKFKMAKTKTGEGAILGFNARENPGAEIDINILLLYKQRY